MKSVLPARYAALGAVLGPGIGALPYLVYFVCTVALRVDSSGPSSVLKALAGAALYVPIVLIGAYLAAIVPAALVGAAYAYFLNHYPHIVGKRSLRVLCACAIAFLACSLWVATFGKLSIIEFVGKMYWPIVVCGVFAAMVLSFFFPKQDRRLAAA